MNWLLPVLTLKEVADTHDHFLVALIKVLSPAPPPTQLEQVTSPNPTSSIFEKTELGLQST